MILFRFTFFLTLLSVHLLFFQCSHTIKNQADREALFSDALSYEKQGNIFKSTEAMKQLCQTGHEKFKYCYFYAVLLLKRHSLNQAIEVMVKQTEIYPKKFQIHRMLGFLYIEKGKLSLSLYHSKFTLSIKPQDKVALLNLGRALDLQGNPNASLLIYKRILQQHKNHSTALHYQSLAYFKKGNYQKAWQSQARVSQTKRNICYMGELLYYVHKFKKSISKLKGCQVKYPKRISSQYILSLSYLNAKDFESSCNVAINLLPTRYKKRILPTLLICSYHIQKYKNANNYVDLLLKNNKTKNISHHLMYYMALTKARLNKHDVAITFFQKVINDTTTNPNWNYNFAISLERSGNTKKSLKYYKIACKQSDKQSCFHVTRLSKISR